MDYTDLKVWLLNLATLLFTFTNLDNFLKLLALITTIGYTLHKWYLLNKNNKSNKNDNE